MSTEGNTGYISNSSERSTVMSTEENTGYISNWSERSTSCQRKKTLVKYRIHQRGPHHVNGRKHWLTYRIHQRGPHHVNGRKHWLHIEFIREVHIMSTEENTGYITNSSERSTSCQRKKTLVTYRFHQNGPHHVNGENTGYISNSSERFHVMPTEENTGYISNSTERSNSCQRKKTLVTYRFHQRGPHHVNGRKHWLHIEFIREVHVMPTEENTGYISNSTERSTSCQRKKTLVTYRIHQRGPHHVNGRKHWYISNSSERSTSCQRKKTMVTYRIHQRCPHHINGRKHWLHIEFIIEVHIMSTEENTGYISNSSERSTSVFFRWHDVDLYDEFDM